MFLFCKANLIKYIKISFLIIRFIKIYIYWKYWCLQNENLDINNHLNEIIIWKEKKNKHIKINIKKKKKKHLMWKKSL